jgi:hypothetical protein
MSSDDDVVAVRLLFSGCAVTSVWIIRLGRPRWYGESSRIE